MNKYLKNPERLIEVRDCLINNPERFRYTDWIEGNTEYITGKEMQCNDNWCGSCACVAGHVISFACPVDSTIENFIGYKTFGDKAIEILGATEDPNFYLFLFIPWDYDYYPETKYDISYDEIISLYEIRKFALAEAISRINWILEEKPLEDYRIDLNLIDQFIDYI